ncbi:MAG: hypothetical protein C4289_00770, partial [Chloroflexota bacterium]
MEVEGAERDGLQGLGELELSVVVPTYNECDNVRALVYRLRRALAYVRHEIIFVDDSTDETPQVIAEQALQYPNIRMHHRHGERGLATAVLAGMVMLTRISIKVRLAWSTVAQMGFMLLECALGLYTLAALHLVGHSIYKAHAFLSASSVV